jgi:uracil-DNA glycosylase
MIEEKTNPDWISFLKQEEEKEYFKILTVKLAQESENYTILPKTTERLKVLTLSPDVIKVVIIGQDPYPTPGHANGLCFSVNDDITPLPKSLNNIFKELKKEYPDFNPKNGNLIHWFNQGVFLINTILTIRSGEPLSHKGIGWEIFTQNLIKYINECQKNIVFLLWGKNAHTFEKFIDASKNLILKTSHPSPLGYTKSGIDYTSFKDSNQFRETNQYLSSNNKGEIHW